MVRNAPVPTEAVMIRGKWDGEGRKEEGGRREEGGRGKWEGVPDHYSFS